MAHHSPIRWYNPKEDAFEWRKAPETDEEVLQVLEGSQYAPRCTRAYQEWRDLGATITAALIRAGEAAKDATENEEDAAG